MAVVRRVVALYRLCLLAVQPRAPSRTRSSSSSTSSTPASLRKSSTSPTSSARSPNRRPPATPPPTTLPQPRMRSLCRPPLTRPPPSIRLLSPTHRQARLTRTHPHRLPRPTRTYRPSHPALAPCGSGCGSTCSTSRQCTRSTSSPPESGVFREDLAVYIKSMLDFHSQRAHQRVPIL
jgi:hypothetical protein